MTDLPPEPRPASEAELDPHATRVLPPDQEPAGPRQRFADRAWSFRALIAVALASVILGGLAGAALANAGGGNDGRGGPMRFHRGGPMGPGSRHWQWGDGPGSGRGTDPMPPWRGQQGPGGPRGPGNNGQGTSPKGPLIPTPPTSSTSP